MAHIEKFSLAIGPYFQNEFSKALMWLPSLLEESPLDHAISNVVQGSFWLALDGSGWLRCVSDGSGWLWVIPLFSITGFVDYVSLGQMGER